METVKVETGQKFTCEVLGQEAVTGNYGPQYLFVVRMDDGEEVQFYAPAKGVDQQAQRLGKEHFIGDTVTVDRTVVGANGHGYWNIYVENGQKPQASAPRSTQNRAPQAANRAPQRPQSAPQQGNNAAPKPTFFKASKRQVLALIAQSVNEAIQMTPASNPELLQNIYSSIVIDLGKRDLFPSETEAVEILRPIFGQQQTQVTAPKRLVTPQPEPRPQPAPEPPAPAFPDYDEDLPF